jgi:hypothetical protein
MSKSRRLTTLWAFMVCYGDSFAFLPHCCYHTSSHYHNFKALISSLHKVYQNSMAKLREWIPRIERRKKEGDMTTCVRKCMVTELRSSHSYLIVAGTTGRTLLLQDNPQETRLVHAADDMDTVGVLVAISRSSCAAHTSVVLTALC